MEPSTTTPFLSGDSIWTAAGGAIAALIGGGFIVRRQWSKDAADRAGDRASIDIIAKLSESLKNAQERQTTLEERADRFAEERNKAIEQKAELQGNVRFMEAKIAWLESELARLRPPVDQPNMQDQ